MKVLTFLAALIFVFEVNAQQDKDQKPHFDIFSFEKTVTLPGTVFQIFDDEATGGISGFWDHFIFERVKPYVEARNSKK